MCSPRKSNKKFLIFTFYESKQMSLTQDLRWSLGRSIALQLQRQTDLLLCTINCFLQWDHLPNMAVGDLAFYYTLYLWLRLTGYVCCVLGQGTLLSFVSFTWAHQGGIVRGKILQSKCRWGMHLASCYLVEAEWLWWFSWYRNNRLTHWDVPCDIKCAL